MIEVFDTKLASVDLFDKVIIAIFLNTEKKVFKELKSTVEFLI